MASSCPVSWTTRPFPLLTFLHLTSLHSHCYPYLDSSNGAIRTVQVCPSLQPIQVARSLESFSCSRLLPSPIRSMTAAAARRAPPLYYPIPRSRSYCGGSQTGPALSSLYDCELRAAASAAVSQTALDLWVPQGPARYALLTHCAMIDWRCWVGHHRAAAEFWARLCSGRRLRLSYLIVIAHSRAAGRHRLSYCVDWRALLRPELLFNCLMVLLTDLAWVDPEE